jgi:outer membrane protein TolC
MKDTFRFNSISDFHAFCNLPGPEHPLVSLIDYSKIKYPVDDNELKWIQNYYSISTTVGLTVPIPVFDWGQGLLARANARSQHARHHKDAVIAETQAELKRAIRLLDHRRSAVRTFEQEIFGKMASMQQMAEDSYRGGQSQLGDLLDASRARFEVKLTHIGMREAVVKAEIDVLAVTGRIEEVASR